MTKKFNGEVVANVKATAMSSQGLGVCHVANKVYFVKNLLVGEEANIEVEYVRNGINYAKVTQKGKDVAERAKPVCKIYKECGGCHLQHLSYEGQKQFKVERVKEAFVKIGNMNVNVNDIVGMSEPYFYRNKVQVPFAYNKRKEIVAGFYQEGTHKIIPFDTCYIQDKVANEVILKVKELMKKNRIQPYDEDMRTGTVRHVLVRRAVATSQMMLVLVTNQLNFPGSNNFVKSIVKEMPFISTVVQNVNSRVTNVILGDIEKVLYGRGFITDVLCGVKFKISAKSFYQVNHSQTEKLYAKAIELANLAKADVIVDAYCGIGTIGLVASKYVQKVIGVEVVKEAIVDAKNNARLNDISNVEFICADASEYMSKYSGDNVDVLFVDPPRKGCDERFLTSVVKLKPRRIIYIACDVATQARDVKYLVANGYKVKEVQPVDMFPQTYHVESIALLELV